MRARYDRPGWTLVSQITGALFVQSWVAVPVDPTGEDGLADPVVILLVACLPAGLCVAALFSGLARRNARATPWIVAFVYGVWLGGWTWLLATSAGKLSCEPPACRSAWGPRLVAFATATAIVFVCARAEARLRRRWASEPS